MSISQYMVIGQYVPSNSFVHKLDPRSKLIFSFFYIFLIFFVKDLTGYGLLFILLVIAIFSSKIPISFYIRGTIPILWMVLFTTILHLTMTDGGDILLQTKWLTIYSEGVYQAIFIGIRLLMLVLIAVILTLTTSSIDLTMGLEKLLYPLSKLGLPIHELALMMSISLRFIPTLLEETEKIMKAQKARGANFDSGPIYKRIISMVAIIIPLFINAFKRADDLANAMEARGYRSGKGRTRLRTLAFSWRDIFLAILLVTILIITIYIRGL